MKTIILMAGLLVCLMAGAVQLVERQAEKRYLISQIQKTNEEMKRMRGEWTRLTLEESVLTDETIVYQIAEQNLRMQLPVSRDVVYLAH